MVVAQEVPLTEDKPVTKEDVLRAIILHKINNGSPIFYKDYLNREYVLGTIGDRGGGKSGSDAVIGIVDFMLAGKPVWSNMKINCDIVVDDETAMEYGLNSGGVVNYQSLPMVKDEVLKLDEKYRNGCLVIEEINVQFSNVRRFMTNTNIDFNEMCQQLRKFQTSLIYNVIDEMFIDPQLRLLTDMFIRTYDTAFDLDAMARKKPTGIDFCWQIYPMTGYLRGEQGRYAVTKKAEKAFFHFHPWQGTYDTLQHQEKGKYSLTKKERELAMSLTAESADTEMMDELKKWRWLEEKILDLKHRKMEVIEGWELSSFIGRPLNDEIKRALKMFGVQYDRFAQAFKINIARVEDETERAVAATA